MTETLTTNDPAQCDAALTRRFVEDSFGERGSEALEVCREENADAKTTFADEVNITEVDVDGAEAQVTVEVTGGDSDGQVVTFDLVHDMGQWKLDRFAEVQIDRPRFERAYAATAVAEGMSDREARCLVGRLRRYTTEELERAMVAPAGPDLPDPRVLCLSRGTILTELEKGIREGGEGLPEPVVDCIVARITEGLSVAQLRALTAAGDAESNRMSALGAAAGKACAREYRAGVLGERPRI